LEIYSDRVELIEQQRLTDPALIHIALALRAALQAGRSGERMYGESLATALAVHLLREYGAVALEPRRAQGGLSVGKLRRAIQYIRDQLHKALTVSEIARSVHMSPHNFTILFKRSIGQSPYHYVIEARTRRAKELLESGKVSIGEVAHQVGFADQSHLTRHIKCLFGVTPKLLLARLDEGQRTSQPCESHRRPFV
jgi:AraC family transcriptional regulator